MTWLDRILPPGLKRSEGTAKGKSVPEGLWIKCPSCDSVLYSTDLENNLNVCPKCEHHMRLTARARLDRLLDPEGRVELGQEIRPVDPLKFRDSRKYSERLTQAGDGVGRDRGTGGDDGLHPGARGGGGLFRVRVHGRLDGSGVGERFGRGVQAAISQRAPFLSITSSGGARMQEGLLSLMQMAKTTAALTRLRRNACPISRCSPTRPWAAFRQLLLPRGRGDCGTGALVGFAGPRVIEQTMREKLPDGFQRAEFLLEKGAIDMIVHRRTCAARSRR
jgi:acetyl-CoA carboxylase carboxyl transferase subunit beta